MSETRLRLVANQGAAAPKGAPADKSAADKRGDLRVVERRRRRRPVVVASTAVVSIFITLFAVAVFQTMLMQGQQHLDSVNRQVSTAEAYYDRLKLEVAKQEAPANVITRAKAMGMIVPDKITYLTPTGAAVMEASTATETPAGSDDNGLPAPGSSWTVTKPFVTGSGG